VEAASTAQEQAVLIGPAVVAASAMWTARLRIDHVVIFQASASKAFKAAVLIVPAVAEGLAVVIASAAAAASVDSAAIALVVAADSAVIGLADSVAAAAAALAGVAADGEINAWNFPILFLEKLKPQTNQ
jgi:hypothetical protein